MSGEQSPFGREVRDTVVKSTATGVALTAIAITALSPTGFGNWVGASVASSFDIDSAASAEDNAYARLPSYPAPMSSTELNEIQSLLASSEASMALVRAATDPKIERARAVAFGDDLVVASPTVVAAAAPQSDLRLALSEPVTYSMSQVESDAPVESYVAVAPIEAAVTPVSYSGGGYTASVPYRDPHLELADLLLAHEQF